MRQSKICVRDRCTNENHNQPCADYKLICEPVRRSETSADFLRRPKTCAWDSCGNREPDLYQFPGEACGWQKTELRLTCSNMGIAAVRCGLLWWMGRGVLIRFFAVLHALQCRPCTSCSIVICMDCTTAVCSCVRQWRSPNIYHGGNVSKVSSCTVNDRSSAHYAARHTPFPKRYSEFSRKRQPHKWTSLLMCRAHRITTPVRSKRCPKSLEGGLHLLKVNST